MIFWIVILMGSGLLAFQKSEDYAENMFESARIFADKEWNFMAKSGYAVRKQ